MDNDTTPTRICKKCGVEYPLTAEYWHKDKKAKQGLAYRCKECAKSIAKQWVVDNADRASETKRQYYAENKEAIHEYRAQNAEHIAAWKREWRRANQDKVKLHKSESQKRNRATANERNRRYRERHAERLRAEYEAKKQAPEWLERNRQRAREHYRNNREAKMAYARHDYVVNYERRRAAQREWAKRNPERAKANSKASVARRRARLKAATGTLTAVDIRKQYAAQRGRCWYCLKPVGDEYHVDHIIPLVQGGTNDARNIVIACSACNLSKGGRTPAEWTGRLF